MSEGQKRKERPQGGAQQGGVKRSKGGSGGKWKMPQYEAKKAEQVQMGTTLATGDQGIWVTFARGMNSKATWEFKDLCAEYGEKMYGIKPFGEGDANAGTEEGEEELDIEASIQKELEALKQPPKKKREVFSFVKTDLDCVFFVKTMAPVDPVAFVRQVCIDARACGSPTERKLKYVNRMTPVTDMDRATESGILKVARAVIGKKLKLKETDDEAEEVKDKDEAKGEETEEVKEAEAAPGPHHTYAIRPTMRNFKEIKSMDIINSIAGIVAPEHTVNLTEPDRVVLVEIFRLFCGVSVVDGKEWETLKRYNVNELYRLAFQEKGISEKDTTGTESRVKKGKKETP